MTDAVRRDARFLAGLGGAALAIVVAGFGPTFFVRDAALGPLPASLRLHGGLLTTWYALAVVQAALAATAPGSSARRTHRLLGAAATLLAVAIVTGGVDVSGDLYARGADGDVLPAASLLFGNLANLVAFTGLVVGGLLARRDRATHARLLVLAGVVILGPAAFRLLELVGLPGPAALAVQGLFVGATARHDRRTLGRVHAATWIALAAIAAVAVGAFTLGATDAWRALADALFAAE